MDLRSVTQPRTKVVKDDNGGLLSTGEIITSISYWMHSYMTVMMLDGNAYSRAICNWTSSFEAETDNENLKRYKSTCTDQILAELIQAEGNKLHSRIHTFIYSIWNEEELPQQWKESITICIYKNGDKTDCSNYRGIMLLKPHIQFYPIFCSQV
jgi:hypothetical protein